MKTPRSPMKSPRSFAGSGPFDYIIVGGGTAGCVLASRLSENESAKVLLIEAGKGHNSFLVNTPSAQQDLQLTGMDWHMETSKQTHLKDRSLFWPRGKLLGGCSSINAMGYVRGQHGNYDEFWPSSWSWKEVLPFFRKSEKFVQGSGVGTAISPLRGHDGPMQVTDLTFDEDCNIWSRRFVKAAVEAGFKANPDYNGDSQGGVAMMQSLTKNGRRVGTAHAFLDAAMARKNLSVWKCSHVTRLVVQGDTVMGVMVRRLGSKLMSLSSAKQLEALEHVEDVFVPVRGEVVLSAGAINSPWLLQSSGIGPRHHLTEMGIPTVADLVVGENLQDHLMTMVMYEAKDKLTLDPYRSVSFKQILAIGKYLLTSKGPVRTPLLEATAFYRTGLDASHNQNDAQILFIPVAADKRSAEELYNNRLIYAGHWDQVPDFGIFFLCCHLLPESRGYVRVVSSNPLVHPLIEPNYLSSKLDMAVHVDLIKKVRSIAASPSWKDVIGDEVIDQNIEHEPSSDEYIREFIRRSGTTIYHPVGTCKMGATDDDSAVVDERLRVKGLKRLRVADASVMPCLPSGNTVAPVIMIAEKAAHMIAEDNSLGDVAGE